MSTDHRIDFEMKKLILLFLLFYTLATNAQNQAAIPRDSIALELAEIAALDQAIRPKPWEKERKLNSVWTSMDSETYKTMVRSIDSINFEKLIDIIDKHGFPSKQTLGDIYKHQMVNTSAMVILLHNPKRLYEERVYALLKQEVEAGRLKKTTLAEYLDKYHVWYEKRSLYDSQFKGALPEGKRGVLITDKHLSDSLRMNIGLPPLKLDEFIDSSTID